MAGGNESQLLGLTVPGWGLAIPGLGQEQVQVGLQDGLQQLGEEPSQLAGVPILGVSQGAWV